MSVKEQNLSQVRFQLSKNSFGMEHLIFAMQTRFASCLFLAEIYKADVADLLITHNRGIRD